MSKYDIVFYIYWVHSSNVHKYLALHNRLKEKCNILTIINEGEFGLTKEEFSLYKEEDKQNVLLLPMSESLEKMKSVDFKIGIFSSNGRKGWVGENGNPPELGKRDIEIAKSKGALSIQISEMITDLYYAGSDIVSLISPSIRQWHLTPGMHRFQWRPYDARPEPKYIYSNCLLWDNTEECLPYTLSREQFYDKYNLNHDEDFYVWLPDTIVHLFFKNAQAKHYQEIYKKVCSMSNVVTKLHPHDYKRHQYFKYGNKNSAELLGCVDTPVIEPVDAHWCYKYAACGISYQSTVSSDFLAYDTPFLYIDFNRSQTKWKGLFGKLGHHCDLSNLKEFISNKKYKKEVPGLRQFYNEVMLFNSERKAVDILAEQIINHIQ